MPDPIGPGARVRTSQRDPAHHTRIPRYVRGLTGTVVADLGPHPLPDDRSRGRAAEPQPCYTVRFAAADIFGAGDHWVHVDLWRDYLAAEGDR